MGDLVYRIFDAALRSEFIPVFVRMKIMRMARLRVSTEATVWPGASFRSSKYSIGSGVFINVGFFFDGCAELVIEDNVRIGQFVRIITGTHEIGVPSQRGSDEVKASAVRLEKGSWIGAGVIVLPGVTIARGCVIDAGAVVKHSTERDGLYSGNPARRVRDLPGAAPSPVRERRGLVEEPVG